MNKNRIIRLLIGKARELDGWAEYWRELYFQRELEARFCEQVKERLGHKLYVILGREELREFFPGDIDIPF